MLRFYRHFFLILFICNQSISPKYFLLLLFPFPLPIKARFSFKLTLINGNEKYETLKSMRQSPFSQIVHFYPHQNLQTRSVCAVEWNNFDESCINNWESLKTYTRYVYLRRQHQQYHCIDVLLCAQILAVCVGEVNVYNFCSIHFAHCIAACGFLRYFFVSCYKCCGTVSI